MKLSKELNYYRQKNDYTQQQLAQKLHVSRKTISNWENRRSEPSFEMLKELSKLYDISTDQLLNSANQKSSIPSKNKTTFKEAWKIFLKRLFRLKGKASRKGYTYVMVPLIVISYILLGIGFLISFRGISKTNLFLMAFGEVIEIILPTIIAIFQTCLAVRRNHDIGISGWTVILIFIPWVSQLYILILMFIPKNTFTEKK